MYALKYFFKSRIHLFTALSVFGWSAVLAGSLYWNIQQIYKNAYEQVLVTARANFFKDQAFRFWASDRGGVYVVPSTKTPPSPWLAHIADRDVTTTSGKKLTLMNPAYMLRQMMDEFSDLYGVKGRIVGIVALNPNNLADPWETEAIHAFEKGVKEVTAYTTMNGKQYLRLMRPMIMTPDCMKCHGHLGFKVGDVRGGVGVSVPMAQYLAPAKTSEQVLTASHLGVWMLGLFGIGYISRHASRSLLERDAHEQALRQAEERQRLVIKASNDGVWDWNIITGESYHSPRWVEILGFTSDSNPTRAAEVFERIHPEDQAQAREALQQHFDHGKPYEVEFRIRHQDGSYRWVLSRGEVLRNAEGQPVRMVGSLSDITERKRLFAEVSQHRERLEELVKARTHELEQAKNQAEQSNSAKSQFLARMSHELRTPLNAILGFSQVLELENLQSEQLDFVQEIQKGGHHLLSLINDLLDLSRIEEGRLTIAIRSVNSSNVIAHACKLIAPLQQQKQLQLMNDCVGGLWVLADETRLRQILVNLLSNAAKYNRDGGSIHLRCERLADQLRISVSDTGPGIPLELQDRLFQPFDRLTADESSIDGAGIGLALSKRLVELMNGKIGVHSARGQGATFWVELPIAYSEESTEIPSSGLSTSTTDIPHSILYIEDNQSNMQVVEALLRRKMGYTLLTARNGHYGLELARQYLPHAILLDIHLPGIDGYEVLRLLRLQAETKHIPIIALSADAMPLDVERGLAAGFYRYLAKPVNLQELLAVLNEVLSKKTTVSHRAE